MPMKAGFLEKLIGRLGKIGPEEVQNYLLRLAQEKGFLETVFNAIQEGIVVTDSSGRITYLNDAACELFGLDCEDLIGMRSPTVVVRSRGTSKFFIRALASLIFTSSL